RISTEDNARLATKLSGLGVTVGGDAEELRVAFDDAIPDTTALSRVCRELNVLITSLGEEPIRLEDLFLDLTAASSDYTAGDERLSAPPSEPRREGCCPCAPPASLQHS